jgi:hypothetical protein
MAHAAYADHQPLRGPIAAKLSHQDAFQELEVILLHARMGTLHLVCASTPHLGELARRSSRAYRSAIVPDLHQRRICWACICNEYFVVCSFCDVQASFLDWIQQALFIALLCVAVLAPCTCRLLYRHAEGIKNNTRELKYLSSGW